MNKTRIFWSLGAGAIAALAVALPAFARPATLVSRDAGSRINVRSAPSTKANAPHYGTTGDRVEVLRQSMGTDQYLWYYVSFSSGAKGWIRGDFVRYNDGATYGVLGGKPGDRINVRSSPSTQASAPHYGVHGDVVEVLNERSGNDGYLWRYVRFPSGARGWVRGDLVRDVSVGGAY